MKTHAEFQSNAFPPYDGEEDEINPGRFGKRLAEFLYDGLKAKGFEPYEPFAEDWGWIVSLRNEGFKLWIGCGNHDDSPDRFLCFIEPSHASIRPFPFLRKYDTTTRVSELQTAIDQLLTTHPQVRELCWLSYNECSKPFK